ncbi:hypothetical protein AXK56_16505 [Tsukamurella pulmonis]|uniref:Uncharacterized protein n=1 Tax=Tsukamurella pulmonis TaxID=47312 RepID=A0A1H1A943_9ACTN|nr:hypothetical protein [Tsukamurella pulmonis]KXO95812.1 hypothetical protein AXK56_16505 [Tsukamurella pulmonis]SDQ36177.1 hypothetical protein SAMN04489765_0112 [Tsukamurella pulmonis]
MTGIREALHDRYSQELSTMDRAGYEEMLDQRTAELELQVEQAASAMERTLSSQWLQEHPGQAIGYMEKLGLLQTARQSATEQVLAQLWEGASTSTDEEPAQPRTWTERWDSEEATAPTQEIEDLVTTLWPEEATETRFRVLAGDLLQARDEDGEQLPAGPSDPLATTLRELVEARVAAIAEAVDEK